MGRIPEVKALLIADSVMQEKHTNKWSLIGVFDRVAAPSYPTARPTLGIYVKLADVKGTLACEVQFRDANDRVLNSIKVPSIVVPESAATLDFGIQTFNLPIPSPGRYHFVLYVNGDLAQMVAMEALKIDLPRPPAEPKPEA